MQHLKYSTSCAIRILQSYSVKIDRGLFLPNDPSNPVVYPLGRAIQTIIANILENGLYRFKELFLWSMWESNPLAGEHPSTDPFAYSSTAANYSTPSLGLLASNILSVSSNSLW